MHRVGAPSEGADHRECGMGVGREDAEDEQVTGDAMCLFMFGCLKIHPHAEDIPDEMVLPIQVKEVTMLTYDTARPL